MSSPFFWQSPHPENMSVPTYLTKPDRNWVLYWKFKTFEGSYSYPPENMARKV